ncbi:MAG: class F sortase [Chloroflexota bacterium]|nr:class F sortase [Chloroflexia bacterium]MDQ3226695.1 class F sortase [Chloroflexota bacterium]
MVDITRRTNRRTLVAGLTVLGATAVRGIIGANAQDDAPLSVSTPAAGIGTIRPTGVGDVPSTGASRPGPANRVRETNIVLPIAPVGLAIETAGIDAGIEALRVVDGAMQDPSGPWVVAWYENLGALGRSGNVVMAGHIDYWNVGPSVFYNLATLQPADGITVSGDDGKVYPYAVEWVRQYDSTSMPIDDVVGPTEGHALTLITCGGAFDYANGEYLQRTVVRANRTGPAQPAIA